MENNFKEEIQENFEKEETSKENSEKVLNEGQTFFSEDIVNIKSQDGKKGVIERVGWEESSESESESEEEDEEDEEEEEEESEEEKLEKDEVLITWSDGTETKEKISNLQLVDRSFLHGDVVSLKTERKMGTIIDVHQNVDIQKVISGEVIQNVSSKKLQKFHPFSMNSYVVQGKNLGRVTGLVVDVFVKFPDDSICKLSQPTPDDILPEGSEFEDESDITFYPTQEVSVNKRSLRRAVWFRGQPKSQKKGIVLATEVCSVSVNWINYDASEPPEEFCSPSSLVVLDYFDYSEWIVNDFALYSPLDEPSIDINNLNLNDTKQEKPKKMNSSEKKKTPKSNPNNNNKSKKKNSNPPKKEKHIKYLEDLEKVVKIISSNTILDVCWQDSSISRNVPSVDLIPADNLLEVDFWPEDFVIEKDSKKIGVIRKVNTKERTCAVSWLEDIQNKEQSEEELNAKTEELPIFSVEEYDGFTFSLKDAVKSFDDGNIGEVIERKNGKFKICWANKQTSWVDYTSIFPALSDEDEEEGEDDEMYGEDEEEEEEQGEENGNIRSISFPFSTKAWWNDSEENSEPVFSNQLLSMLTSFGRQLGITLVPPSQSINLATHSNSTSNQPTITNPKKDENNDRNKNEEEKEEKEEKLGTFLYKEEPKDNQFELEQSIPLNLTQFATRVLKDIELLKTNLPEGVYVRVYGSRIDLLQLMIVGPEGTPYQDCLFIFDLQFPSNYPNSPPNIHFKSYGDKLNPNLYKEGRVCLSLLGTWQGKGVEVWNGNSNVLQVVVSIQGLIIGTSEPYFLEAGYEKLRGSIQAHQASKLYNEMVFLASLAAIPAMLEKPPADFKDQIIYHFQKRGPVILARLKKYLDIYHGKCESDPSLFLQETSSGFCKSLEKLYPKIEECFQKLETIKIE